jgi:ferritin-like metal-binding protein YciE
MSIVRIGSEALTHPEITKMAAEKNLADAFYETLKDVYFAEKQSVKACKKSAKASTAPELKKAFEQHGEESAHHVERLTQVFEILGKPARAKTCDAMQGITSALEEDLEDFGGTAAADAVIIGCGQAIEHYEMARYGLLKSWATQLGMSAAAKLLDETLQEEKKADALLTQIAEKVANRAAQAGMKAA